MRSRLFWVIVLLIGSASVTLAQAPVLLSIVAAENAPVSVESADVEAGPTTGLRVRFVVVNSTRKAIERLVVTAATIGPDQRVTAVRIRAIELTIEPQARKDQYVVFPQIVPTSGERVVFGVQAVGWSGGKEWRGVVRLAAAAPVNAGR